MLENIAKHLMYQLNGNFHGIVNMKMELIHIENEFHVFRLSFC